MNMRIKRGKRCLLALWLLVGLLISGCGQRIEEGHQDRVTIRYATFERLPAQVRVIRRIIELFEERYPGIRVRLEIIADDPIRKITTQIVGGDAPDVFYWSDLYLPPLAERGVLMDLQPFIDRDEEIRLDDFFPEGVELFRMGDRLYGLPVNLGVRALYFNKDLFDKAGVPYPDDTWTKEDFLQAAKALTKDFDGDGRTDQFGTLSPHVSPCPVPWIKANGGRLFNEDQSRSFFDEPAAREVFQFAVDLVRKYGVAPTPAELRGHGGGMMGLIRLFQMGKVAMFSGGAYMLTEFKELPFNWDVAPLPRLRAGRPVAFWGGANVIPRQTRHPEEAFKFARFFSSKEAQILLAGIRNAIPALRPVAEKYLEGPPESIHVFLEAIADGHSRPKFSWYKEFLSKSFSRDFELAMLGQQSVEQAVENMTHKGNEFLAELAERG
ncbi:sugar ABC transporter substrate-binding protein [candidate division NPL-UPA2 bacterium]|nr:sugar ABC transporter substrate-binding protein [candidate division NPL-UPA2 bacterium]